MVDEIGYLEDAIELAKKKAGLTEARVVTYRRPGEYQNNVYSRLFAPGTGLAGLANIDVLVGRARRHAAVHVSVDALSNELHPCLMCRLFIEVICMIQSGRSFTSTQSSRPRWDDGRCWRLGFGRPCPVHGAWGWGGAGSVGSMTGCYRAPGTARDQFIYFSEEKEMRFGLAAFREVLRQRR